MNKPVKDPIIEAFVKWAFSGWWAKAYERNNTDSHPLWSSDRRVSRKELRDILIKVRMETFMECADIADNCGGRIAALGISGEPAATSIAQKIREKIPAEWQPHLWLRMSKRKRDATVLEQEPTLKVHKLMDGDGQFWYQVQEKHPCRHARTHLELQQQVPIGTMLVIDEWDSIVNSEDSYVTLDHHEVRIYGLANETSQAN